MPQPLREGELYVYPTKSMALERPELAALIGHVCAAWTLVDREIMHAYGLVLGLHDPVTRSDFSTRAHPVAFQIFDSLYTLNPRLELLAKLVKWTLKEDEAAFMRDAIIPNLKRRYKERSEIAHGLWTVPSDPRDTTTLIRLDTFGTAFAYRKADFQAIVQRIEDAQDQVRAFTRNALQRIQDEHRERHTKQQTAD